MPSRSLLEDSRRIARSALAQVRALPRPALVKMGICAAALALFGAGLAMRGEDPSDKSPAPAAPHVRSAAAAEAPHAAGRRHVAAPAPAPTGDYKADVETYAAAARKGDARSLSRLVAMTRAQRCEVRSEAAEALASLRGRKATAALKRLSHASFKDESRSPGLFSCSSRRVAEKALEKQARG